MKYNDLLCFSRFMAKYSLKESLCPGLEDFCCCAFCFSCSQCFLDTHFCWSRICTCEWQLGAGQTNLSGREKKCFWRVLGKLCQEIVSVLGWKMQWRAQPLLLRFRNETHLEESPFRELEKLSSFWHRSAAWCGGGAGLEGTRWGWQCCRGNCWLQALVPLPALAQQLGAVFSWI